MSPIPRMQQPQTSNDGSSKADNNNAYEPKMIRVPAGLFWMGSF